nr:isochorismate synthase MenF [Serratia sp. Se-RSmG]
MIIIRINIIIGKAQQRSGLVATLTTENQTFPGFVYAEQSTFLYRSEFRSLSADGVFERIETPAFGGEQEGSALAQHIRQALARAKAAGQETPVVVGAIPFDTRRPSCLYVPENCQFVANDSFTRAARPMLQQPHRLAACTSIPDEPRFKHAVAEAVSRFKQGKLDKAVLSRILDIELEQPVAGHQILNNLMVQNPTGYHFSLPLADGGVLIGASPELLIRKQGGEIHTNPLAGSARRQDDPQQDRLGSERLMRSTKDKYEHKLVIDDIRRHLAPLCASLSVPSGPSLLSTGTMWHLSTRIRGELLNPNLNVMQLACLLHPTPALCGFPTESARQLIADLEPHDRGLFSGIVGWCDANGDGEWAIVIRSGLLRGNRVRLFAGAGIVAASTPQSEWLETAAKLGTMLNAFGLNSGAL